MHKIPTDAFDMLVTLEKRPFERAGREVVVRLLDETLPDGTKLVAASDPSYPPELAALEEHPAVLVHEGDLSLTERQTDDNPLRRILPAAEQMMHQPADETYHDDAEYAEQQFSPVESPFRGDVHAESRAVVLDKP